MNTMRLGGEMTDYTCKQCGEEVDGWEISHCEICNKEGALCCITPTFITKVGNGMDIDMYFCEGCEVKFTDTFLLTHILPSHHPYLAHTSEDERDYELKKQKDGIRKIMAAMDYPSTDSTVN